MWVGVTGLWRRPSPSMIASDVNTYLMQMIDDHDTHSMTTNTIAEAGGGGFSVPVTRDEFDALTARVSYIEKFSEGSEMVEEDEAPPLTEAPPQTAVAADEAMAQAAAIESAAAAAVAHAGATDA